MIKQTLVLTALALAVAVAPAARADSTTYNFTQQSWKSGSGSYGTVQVNEATGGLSATVTVSLQDGFNNIFFNQGGPASAGDAFEFNLNGNASQFTIASMTTGFESDVPAPDNNYGSFDFGVTCDYKGGACRNASQQQISSLEFTITSKGVPIVFTPTGNVLFAAAVTDQPLSSEDPTGNIAVPAVAPTPEPSSLMLLGTGVLGAAGALRRRLKA